MRERLKRETIIIDCGVQWFDNVLARLGAWVVLLTNRHEINNDKIEWLWLAGIMKWPRTRTASLASSFR
jgi:hypothetical protein